MHADVNGVTLAYEDLGSSAAPPLLLVHGHPFDRSMWQPQIAAFGKAPYRVIAPDLRGYGGSAVVAGTTTLDVFACDLDALLLARGVVGKVVLCGLSMGGQIVMEFARLFPGRVAALVLAATFPQAETASGKVARRAMAERLLTEGMGPYAAEVLPKMLAPATITARPDIAAMVLAMMQAAHPEGAAAALRGRAERPPYEDVLASLAVPALIVVGDSDAFTTRADALAMHRLLRDSELLWLPGVGHMPNLEAEPEFNAGLARLYSRLA